MKMQLTATSYLQRKKALDRVQEILPEYESVIFLARPDNLVGAKN